MGEEGHQSERGEGKEALRADAGRVGPPYGLSPRAKGALGGLDSEGEGRGELGRAQVSPIEGKRRCRLKSGNRERAEPISVCSWARKGKGRREGDFGTFPKTTFEALLFSGFEPTINSDKNLNLSP